LVCGRKDFAADLGDQSCIVGKECLVVTQSGRLARSPCVFQVERQELSEQSRPGWPGLHVEEAADFRALSGLPRGLEAVANLID
jgi:hypothetical protein